MQQTEKAARDDRTLQAVKMKGHAKKQIGKGHAEQQRGQGAAQRQRNIPCRCASARRANFPR